MPPNKVQVKGRALLSPRCRKLALPLDRSIGITGTTWQQLPLFPIRSCGFVGLCRPGRFGCVDWFGYDDQASAAGL